MNSEKNNKQYKMHAYHKAIVRSAFTLSQSNQHDLNATQISHSKISLSPKAQNLYNDENGKQHTHTYISISGKSNSPKCP